MIRIIVYLLLSFIFILPTKGAVKDYYSIVVGGSGGLWSNGGYWSNTSGGIPCGCAGPGTPTSDNAYIETNMNLDINVSSSGIINIASGSSLQSLTRNLEIKAGGHLIVSGILKVYDLTFYNGSFVTLNPGGQIIVLNNLTNMNNSDNVSINGSVSVTGTFQNGNGGIISGTGQITAGTFTGVGTTFGYENGTIPPGTTVSTGSLPIELVSFSATSEKGIVDLKWSTSAEINNDYFSIERSKDGVNFEIIDRIKGQGNSNTLTNYSYSDNNPLHGISYYRLRQTDFDGKNSTSEIVYVDISKMASLPISMEIYPNPLSQNENINIKISEYEPETEVLVVVRNLLGQELYSKVVMTDFSGNSITAIDLENRLPAGTYLIIGTSLNQTFNKYLIIK